jgi:hypothetical protein
MRPTSAAIRQAIWTGPKGGKGPWEAHPGNSPQVGDHKDPVCSRNYTSHEGGVECRIPLSSSTWQSGHWRDPSLACPQAAVSEMRRNRGRDAGIHAGRGVGRRATQRCQALPDHQVAGGGRMAQARPGGMPDSRVLCLRSDRTPAWHPGRARLSRSYARASTG